MRLLRPQEQVLNFGIKDWPIVENMFISYTCHLCWLLHQSEHACPLKIRRELKTFRNYQTLKYFCYPYIILIIPIPHKCLGGLCLNLILPHELVPTNCKLHWMQKSLS
uniref:Uncharacterized protein n=1 Tax=Pararge aegeria TaxID=116150 RepID=S4PM17_9NEOP